MKDELIERLNAWPGGIGRLDTLNATFVGGIMSEAAAAGAADNARVVAAETVIRIVERDWHGITDDARTAINRFRALLKETPDVK